ncbi:unnamed protein product [Paramecium sonneborni]|uniref:Uncharacterized protein n=1 Tax=Paramecium sonneborni TaxID=65129 RepID=A0A8S1R149_9CILI|nr:unnamed protein product [Paramecium sonneborni]
MLQFGLDYFTKKSLPQDFAEQVLKLEMDIDLNEQTQHDQLQQLISLYMVGVEYYESIKDKRQFFFQKKLNALIHFASYRENEEFLLSKEAIENKRAKFEKESKRIELDLICSQTESKEAQVKGIVDNHTYHVKQIQNMIQNEMASQTDAFQTRLERRRKSKILHSQSQTEIDLQSYSSTLLIKKTEYKEQGCIKIVAQTKQIIQEEEEISRKNSTFQYEYENLNYQQKLMNSKRHQRSGSLIPIQQIEIKQKFLSQGSLEYQDEKDESIHKQLIHENN